MAKYILLVNWTDQGIRNVKDSAKRLDAGRALAKEQGCVLESFFMTMGSFDNVAVVEAPNTRPRRQSWTRLSRSSTAPLSLAISLTVLAGHAAPI